MAFYPKWNPDAHPADHLLFDVGYSYAMLRQSDDLLRAASEWIPQDNAEGTHLLEEIEFLLECMRSLREGRLQIVNEVYAAAEEAAKRIK